MCRKKGRRKRKLMMATIIIKFDTTQIVTVFNALEVTVKAKYFDTTTNYKDRYNQQFIYSSYPFIASEQTFK